jgi:AcrR family transcriptional regulator
MATRREQKEQTRRRLLLCAFDLFSSRGITATKTVDVAREASVSHGTVFVHFPTRDDLVAAVISEFTKRIVRRIHELVESGATLQAVLAAHLEGLSEHEAFYARLITEGPILPPVARTTLIGIQSAISYHLAEAAEKEMNQGSIRRVPIHLLFNTWIGLVHHYLCNRDLFAPGQSVLKRRGQELIVHYVGLLSPTSNKEE